MSEQEWAPNKSNRGRNILIIVLVVALLGVVGVIIGGGFLKPGQQGAPETNSPVSTASGTGTAAPTGTAVASTGGAWQAVVPNGCLAGTNRPMTAAFLDAQKKAGHTTVGAVSYAGLYIQYAWALPREPQATRMPGVDAGVSNTVGDAATKYSSYGEGRYGEGLSAEGSTLAKALDQGRYRIDSEEPDKVVVSIVATVLKDGQLVTKNNEGGTAATRVTVVWENGAWRIIDVIALADAATIFDQGSSFGGGC